MAQRLTCLILLVFSTMLGAGELDRTGTQWSPYIEWSLTNTSWSGNPYDLTAAATFTHGASGETRVTEMFYGGSDTWKFRFTATRTGTWNVTTSSSDSNLNGKTGTITISANSDPDVEGFLTNQGNQFAIMKGPDGDLEGYVFTVFMNGVLEAAQGWNYQDMGPNLSTVRTKVNLYLDNAFDNGIETIFYGVYNSWFKYGTWKYDEHSSTNPDPVNFRVMETVITEAHKRGARVHIWAWGDQQRHWTPVGVGGINGTADRRLQRYIAARLGPLPGWSMGYGFDLHEWTTPSQLESWGTYLQDRMGWPHMLCTRGEKMTNSSPTMNSYDGFGRSVELYTTSGGPQDFNEVIGDFDHDAARPAFYEERHSYLRSGFDLSMNGTRRLMWWEVMSGGVGGFFGFYSSSPHPYPNREQLRCHYDFWHAGGRYILGMSRANGLTNGYCLKTADSKHYVFYREGASSIQMDLSGMGTGRPAVAVDCKKEYAEIDLGILSASSQTWSAPYSSDWAIAVGDFSGNSGPSNTPPSVDAGSNQTITLPDDDVSLDATVTDPDDNPSTAWTKQSGPGTVTFGNPVAIDTTATFGAAGTYVLKLTADDGTNASVSDTVTVTVEPEPLNAPSGLNAAEISDTRINLSWTDNSSNETGFRIERASGAVGKTVVLKTYNGVNETPTIEAAGTVNSFKSGAKQTVDRSNTWGSIPASLDGACRLLTARDDKADVGYNTMYVVTLSHAMTVYATVSPEYGNTAMEFMDASWTDSGLTASISNGTEFNLWKKDAPAGDLILGTDDDGSKQGATYIFPEVGSGGAFTEIATVGANVTSYNDTGLTASTEYTYRVRAYSAADNSGYSNEASATTEGGTVNAPPTVDAGSNQTIILPDDDVNLNATVTDPDDTPSTAWTKQSGPGSVSFGNAANIDTSAQFSAAGSYVLRLTADDGTNSPVFDTVTITVNPDPGADADGDGMDDVWETANGVDDPDDDPDNDGLTNLEEFQNGTDPKDGDSDGDGLDDGVEITYGLDPTDGGDAAADNDGDGLTNAEEIIMGTDLNDTDTDNDGLDDLVDPDPLVPATGGTDDDEGTKGGCTPGTAGVGGLLTILLSLWTLSALKRRST